jgi:multidrug resistance efflux pump
MVVKLPIREGMRVAKDHVLAQLEDTDYQADNARAKATLELARQALLELERGFRPDEIAQAKAELAETEAQQVQAEAEWKRSRGLRERGVMSEQDFESAESRYNALNRRVERLRYALRLMEEGPRKERIAMARAQVLQAEADLAKTQWKLDNCTIRAPISGTILKKNAEEGNIVNPIAFNGSYSLCEMADLANLEVDLTIQERDIAQIFAGQKCKVRAEAFPERTYEGVVSRLMPIADRAKGAIPVRVKVSVPPDEEGVYLKPEMGVVVSFLNKQASGEPPAAKATR